MKQNVDRRVVVTGIGVITSNGKNQYEFFENCFKGISGLKKCTLFDVSNFRTKFAGEILRGNYPHEETRPNEKTRIQYLIEDCIEEMLFDSGLTVEYISSLDNKAYLSFATSLGTNDKILQYEKEKGKKGVADSGWLLSICELLPEIKKILGIEGGCYTTTTACAASTTAAGIGYDLIKSGRADLVIVGGADPLSEFSFYGFNALRALSESRCKPFDKNRDGINIGEGCGFLVLESLHNARNRKAKIYAEFIGYGINNDAYHITSPNPQGEGAYLSMRMACEDDQETINSIDYINAHGTGTKLNDRMELRAIQRLFQRNGQKVLVSSTKSLIGHCLAAAGIIELILTILMIKNGICICNRNLLDEMDEVEYNNVTLLKNNVRSTITRALSNNFAFAGNTASILVGSFID